jgi:prepilin-type N-terminal cleavage/methylation domain-containing protein
MRARGFTLIELLVALGIASIAIAGALAALSQVYASWHATQTQMRLHERALYVLATLEPEIQMAGFFGSGPAPAWTPGDELPASLMSCGTLLPRVESGIDAPSGAWPLNCAAQAGGATTNGTVLVIRRVAANAAAPEPGRLQLLDSESMPALRQWRWDGNPPASAGIATDVTWKNLLLRAYYVAQQSDGDLRTPALRVKSLTAVAGRPTFVDTEVMPGVTQLSIELLPDSIHPSSAHLTLVVQVDAAESRHGQAPARLTLTREFALRNAPQS